MAASDWCHLIMSTHSNYPDLTGYKLGLLSGDMTRWAYKSATHTRVKTRGALSAFEPLRSCELGSLSRSNTRDAISVSAHGTPSSLMP